MPALRGRQHGGRGAAGAARRHIKVPEQVKLASFYDSELLTSSTPQISAAQFDGERLGATACRMLLDILAGKQIALRQMQGYQVILRESTK